MYCRADSKSWPAFFAYQVPSKFNAIWPFAAISWIISSVGNSPIYASTSPGATSMRLSRQSPILAPSCAASRILFWKSVRSKILVRMASSILTAASIPVLSRRSISNSHCSGCWKFHLRRTAKRLNLPLISCSRGLSKSCRRARYSCTVPHASLEHK